MHMQITAELHLESWYMKNKYKDLIGIQWPLRALKIEIIKNFQWPAGTLSVKWESFVSRKLLQFSGFDEIS